ncbi:DUF1565 domain-containing protein [Massilia sp. H6]|uniref:DUF1565 domain-containing protein n=1 Tax=Massilia sp. H6 TaxID=2970464 RepID=UPI002167BBEA|nr:DUF1565 domain-containing protein [Massilia sp. H6]UVW30305.1 DUF1565 domain-containing protein [Massilia sp. H6]
MTPIPILQIAGLITRIIQNGARSAVTARGDAQRQLVFPGSAQSPLAVPNDCSPSAWACKTLPAASCAILGILLAACSGGKHLYVAPSGSDTNPGTKEAPFATISHADSRAAPGFTIHVAPGIYRVAAPSPGSAGIHTVKSGTANDRIRFVSDRKWGAKIVFSGTGIAWNSEGAFVDIDGFDISGTGRIGILAKGGNEHITRNFVHDLTVSGGCNGRGGAAINTWGPVGGAVIDSNVVRNIGLQWLAGRTCNTVQGIYVANANNRILNNVISGVASVGINSWHGGTASTIVNNTILNSKMGIVIGHGDSGATAAGTSNNYVANNIVFGNGHGITEMGKVGGNNRYVNNLVHSNNNNWRVMGQVIGTISADPMFLNFRNDGTGDYRLHTMSPATGLGANIHLRMDAADARTGAPFGAQAPISVDER